MKERYLLIFDLDGTLLNDKKEISFLTKCYLKKLNKKGHVIVLASGRPFRSMERYYDELKLNTPIVCYNGANCFNPKDKNYPQYEFKFPKEVIKEMYTKLKPYIHNVMCETNDEIWIDQDDGRLAKFFCYENMQLHYGDLNETLDKDPMTMIVQTGEEFSNREEIVNIVAQYENISPRFWTGYPYFELFYEKTSKASAVKYIAEHYNIKKENIIAFGDSTNDIELCELGGTFVAMKNGKPQLKEKADILSAKDNNHNGIYFTLKKLLKGKI